MMRSKIIAVDFDGTLCKNKYPEIGEPNEELIRYLKDQQKEGAKIILWTCRVGRLLQDAIRWCGIKYGLCFDAVNENLPETIDYFGGDTRKIYADEYIDDKNKLVSSWCEEYKVMSAFKIDESDMEDLHIIADKFTEVK